MASLKSNLLISTLTTIVVGSIRPAFNAVNNHAFGAEHTGHLAALVSILYLASLPAIAGLPAIMVVQVSKAQGAGDRAKAAAFARYCLLLSSLCALLGAALAAGFVQRGDQALAPELAALVLGVLGYAHWRFVRSLLLARGEAAFSLRVDLVSLALLGGAMGLVVALRAGAFSLAAFVVVYLGYGALTAPALSRAVRGGELTAADRRLVLSYAVVWFIGTAASIGTNEVATLVLDARVPRSLVGDFGVALSFLTPIGFAPRVLELPLIHELSRLEGGSEEERQRALTTRAVRWLSLLVLGAGGGAALLAEPLLFLGKVTDPEVRLAFAALALGFSLEIMQTPASNLVAVRTKPRTLMLFGLLPFLAACGAWLAWPGGGLRSVVLGMLAASSLKAVMFTLFVSRRFGVRYLERPLAQGTAVVLLFAALALVHSGHLSPWLGAPGFGVALLALFRRELGEIYSTLRRR